MRAAAVALALALSGCTIGVSQSEFARPGGEMTTAHVGDAEIVGELLAVQDDGLLLVAGRGIVLVPYAIISDVEFGRLEDFNWPRGRAPSAGALERLRLVSRFPQGVDGDLLERLLEARNQPELLRCRTGSGQVPGPVVECVP
jgi:hypothetical protein